MKTLIWILMIGWLAGGLGMHAYFSRVAQGPAEVEEKRDLYLRQFEANDEVARQVRESHGRTNNRIAGAYLGWAGVGVVVGALSLRSLFQRLEKSLDA